MMMACICSTCKCSGCPARWTAASHTCCSHAKLAGSKLQHTAAQNSTLPLRSSRSIHTDTQPAPVVSHHIAVSVLQKAFDGNNTTQHCPPVITSSEVTNCVFSINMQSSSQLLHTAHYTGRNSSSLTPPTLTPGPLAPVALPTPAITGAAAATVAPGPAHLSVRKEPLQQTTKP
jgi:hypothetical protein